MGKIGNKMCTRHLNKVGRGRQMALDLDLKCDEGVIHYNAARRSYIAEPASDSARVNRHMDSTGSAAPQREFSVKEFGEDARTRAQEYLCGCRFNDITGTRKNVGEKRA